MDNEKFYMILIHYVWGRQINKPTISAIVIFLGERKPKERFRDYLRNSNINPICGEVVENIR